MSCVFVCACWVVGQEVKAEKFSGLGVVVWWWHAVHLAAGVSGGRGKGRERRRGGAAQGACRALPPPPGGSHWPAPQHQLGLLHTFALTCPTPAMQWDVSFWAERLKEAKYSISDEELRPYFALPHVLEGLFKVGRGGGGEGRDGKRAWAGGAHMETCSAVWGMYYL